MLMLIGIICLKKIERHGHLNTSNVNVNLKQLHYFKSMISHLNTSNVNVNQRNTERIC